MFSETMHIAEEMQKGSNARSNQEFKESTNWSQKTFDTDPLRTRNVTTGQLNWLIFFKHVTVN